MRWVGYIRVSTGEQAASGLGLDAQAERIRSALDAGDELVEILRDEGESGKDLNRPGITTALQMIATGEADGLVVAKLDRVSRSTIDCAMLLEWFDRAGHGIAFRALDLGIDTSTSAGRLVASVMAAVAEWERSVISERTRDGLAARRAQGGAISQPATVDDPALAARILTMRADGATLQAIADTLNREGVPTLRGGSEWRPSSVRGAAGYKRRKKAHQAPALPVISRRKS